VHLNNVQTRSRSKNSGQTQSEQTETEPPNRATENSKESDKNIYADYDKEYQAERERRRRVRFQIDVLDSQPVGEEEKNGNTVEDTEQTDSTELLKERTIQPRVTLSKKQKQQQAKAINEAERRGVKDDKSKETEKDDEYDLYKEPKYHATTKNNIEMYRDDQFKNESEITEVSDYTLATFLMEHKVKL